MILFRVPASVNDETQKTAQYYLQYLYCADERHIVTSERGFNLGLEQWPRDGDVA